MPLCINRIKAGLFLLSSTLGVQTLSFPSPEGRKWKCLTEQREWKFMFLLSFLSLAFSFVAIFYTKMTPTGYSYKHGFCIIFLRFIPVLFQIISTC